MKPGKILSRISICIFCAGLLWNCSSLSTEKIAYQQSYDNGKALYQEECAKCHKATGEGLGTLYPPLANSDYFKSNTGKLACIISKGMRGPITVNGVQFNWAMPDHKSLEPKQIAAIMTYVQNIWGGPVGLVGDSTVVSGLKGCGK
jgi:cytochrome c551